MKRPIWIVLALSSACATPASRSETVLSADQTSSAPGLPKVSIQLTVADMPRARADQLFGADDSSGSVRGPELPRRLEELAREGAGVEIEQRAQLILLDAHRGDIQVGSPESYVRDFEVDAAEGIADPVIDTLWEGLRFDAQPQIRTDGGGIDLDFHLEISTLKRPIRESIVEIPDLGLPVTVEMPECTVLSVRRRITLRSGEVFVFALEPEADEPGRDRTKVVAIEVGIP